MGYWHGPQDRYVDEAWGALRGRPLRYVLITLLRDAAYDPASPSTVTVAQLVVKLLAAGVVIDGRASKVVSDALRWEVRRGRVNRLERGVYSYAGAPRSTVWRIRQRAAAIRTHLAWAVIERHSVSRDSWPERMASFRQRWEALLGPPALA
jgi:hypothetical protein